MRVGDALVLAGGVIALAGRAAAQPAAPEAPEQTAWVDGDHLTGEWGGARTALADRGVTIDVVYASDMFTARGETAALGHVDAAVTLDSHKLGLWDGGTLYVLGQNNHGSGINAHVGSAVGVSNLEAAPYTQLVRRMRWSQPVARIASSPSSFVRP